MNPTESIVLDATVLINFLQVEKAEQLLSLPGHRFLITNIARGEVSRPAQAAVLRRTLLDGRLEEVEVSATAVNYGELRERLDDGEASALAFALERGCAVALDDAAAKKLARRRFPSLKVVDTADLVVRMIHAGLLSIEDADSRKEVWATRHRFKLPFRSFRELLS